MLSLFNELLNNIIVGHEYLGTLTLLVGSFQQADKVLLSAKQRINHCQLQCTELVFLNSVYWAQDQPFHFQLVQTVQLVFYSCKERRR